MNSLENRTHPIRHGLPRNGPVAYWMSRDQRVSDNWALIYAQNMAIAHGLPLLVIFCLAQSFLGASLRHYGFMLRGLCEISQRLKELSIPFFVIPQDAGTILPQFIARHNVSFLVTDFDPLRTKKQWKECVAQEVNIPFYEVDTHNIVPCRIASDKREYTAHGLRRKIRRLLPLFLDEIPTVKRHPHHAGIEARPIDPDVLLEHMTIDRSVDEIPGIIPGENAAKAALSSFLDRLGEYEARHNNPVSNGQSHLSAYLHFGQLSPQRVALEVKKSDAGQSAKEAYLEQLIIRRELSDNYCHYTPDYDRFEAFPEWAKKTLDGHRFDRRSYLYSRRELEMAQTHDPLWNAAQIQMVTTGRMHGYMRMYWAKKILEWTRSPEEALSDAIYLNDRYELDGRDPNGYTGIAWSIGGLHDRPWAERNIYGKIRFMSYNGCASKFNVKRYIEAFKP